ncbi:C-type lectin domain family 6 member A-like [Acomys russatus]|uniref:C-type lectin domain family 6 member A-like n=1 Tax=Acomys russatus TaxID=60746 RepID=UPI0021E1FA57|nr:C-type lectin domain family 6 member A-like [Acomys russatus]
MVEESQPQGAGVCWTLRLWSVAVISILLLSTCFIMSCVDRVWSCCPMNWKPFGSNCYFTSTDSLASWNESEAKCSSMGAHLLVIHSKEEQDFITGILDTSAAYFIGLRDEGDRQWRWVDQTSYNKSATFWHEGEPNNDEEQCVTLESRLVLEDQHFSRDRPYWRYRHFLWRWNDAFCSLKENSICQMKKIYL